MHGSFTYRDMCLIICNQIKKSEKCNQNGSKYYTVVQIDSVQIINWQGKTDILKICILNTTAYINQARDNEQCWYMSRYGKSWQKAVSQIGIHDTSQTQI